MTIDELKIEADQFGYRLIKKQEYIRLLPCVCGHNSRTLWWRMDGLFYECNQCGRRAPIGSTEAEAGIFDTEEIHHGCAVQIWSNSRTGETSVGWWKE